MSELDLLCVRVVSSGAPLTAVEVYGNVPTTAAGQERVCVSRRPCVGVGVTLTADWPDGSLAVGATRENCHINLSGLPSPRDACFGVYCNTFMSPTVT